MTDFDKYIAYLENEVKKEQRIALAAYKKRALDVCRAYRDKSENYIRMLENENREILGVHQAEMYQAKTIISKFMLICAIHGITDYKMMVENRSMESLIEQHESMKSKNQVQLPGRILKSRQKVNG